MSSLARRSLNRAINKYSNLIKGKVLDIGGEKENSISIGAKGYLSSWNKNKIKNNFSSWEYLNINERYKPDLIGDAENIPCEDEIYDCAICFELLAHANNPEKVLKEISRILKTNGLLFLSMPYMYRHHPNPLDMQRWSSEKIHIELEKHNLSIKIVETRGAWLVVLFDVLINGLLSFKRGTFFSSTFFSIFGFLIGKFFLLLTPFIFYLDDFLKNEKKTSSNFHRYTTGFFVVAEKINNLKTTQPKNYMKKFP